MLTTRHVTTADVGEALCHVLCDGNDVHRCLAAGALGRIGYAPAADALTEALLNEDEDVRSEAADALGRLGDARAGRALIRSLIEDPCGAAKLNAVEALGRLRDASAVSLLRRLARARDESVMWDEEELLGGWDDWLDVQLKAVQALGEIGTVEAVPDIVAALDDEMGQDLSEAGMHALVKLGEPGVRALTKYLALKDTRMRRRAVRALATIDSKTARDALVHALSDESADVRLGALRALAARNAADHRLATLFDDPSPAVRAAMVRLCGHVCPERLDACLDDPGDEVQMAVVQRLADEPDLTWPENLEFRLRVKARGPSEQVAVVACQAMAVLFPEVSVEDFCEQLHDRVCPVEVRRAAAKALGRIGSDRAIETLRGSVDDETRLVRLEAIAALAQIAATQDQPGLAEKVLLAALRGELVGPPDERHDTEPDVNARETKVGTRPSWPKTTLQALTSGNTVSAPAALVNDDPELAELARAPAKPRRKHVPLEPDVVVDEDVRRFAARVLGDVPGGAVAAALAEVLTDPNTELRRTAADSLARRTDLLSGEVRDALMAVLDDADRDLRLAATRALRHGGPEAVAALAQRLHDDDSYVRAEAARALAALDADHPDVAALLDDRDPGVRLAAAEAVSTRRGPDAARQLMELAFAHAGMHCRDVARLLWQSDRFGARARFLQVLEDAEQQNRWRVAIEALAELYRLDVGPETA